MYFVNCSKEASAIFTVNCNKRIPCNPFFSRGKLSKAKRQSDRLQHKWQIAGWTTILAFQPLINTTWMKLMIALWVVGFLDRLSSLKFLGANGTFKTADSRIVVGEFSVRGLRFCQIYSSFARVTFTGRYPWLGLEFFV